MSIRLSTQLPRNRLPSGDRPVAIDRPAAVESRRRRPVRPLSDDDEGRFIRKWVIGFVLVAVTPLLIFLVVHYFHPRFFHIEITPG